MTLPTGLAHYGLPFKHVDLRFCLHDLESKRLQSLGRLDPPSRPTDTPTVTGCRSCSRQPSSGRNEDDRAVVRHRRASLGGSMRRGFGVGRHGTRRGREGAVPVARSRKARPRGSAKGSRCPRIRVASRPGPTPAPSGSAQAVARVASPFANASGSGKRSHGRGARRGCSRLRAGASAGGRPARRREGNAG